jgi:hypothetical protein
MDARERETLVAALGPEDAEAVERFLGAGCALCGGAATLAGGTAA